MSCNALTSVGGSGARLEDELGDMYAAHICYITAGVLPTPAISRPGGPPSTYIVLGCDVRSKTVFTPQVVRCHRQFHNFVLKPFVVM